MHIDAPPNEARTCKTINSRNEFTCTSEPTFVVNKTILINELWFQCFVDLIIFLVWFFLFLSFLFFFSFFFFDLMKVVCRLNFVSYFLWMAYFTHSRICQILASQNKRSLSKITISLCKKLCKYAFYIKYQI